MPICEYNGCGGEFTPNPNNRTNNPQRFCEHACRTKAWMEKHPRIMPNKTEGWDASIGKRTVVGGVQHNAGAEPQRTDTVRVNVEARREYGKIKTAVTVLEYEHRLLTCRMSQLLPQNQVHAMRKFDVGLGMLKKLIEDLSFHNAAPEDARPSPITRSENPGLASDEREPGNELREGEPGDRVGPFIPAPARLDMAASPFPHGDRRGRRSSVRPDLHLTALAKTLGVGPDYLSKLFRGIGTPSVPMAEKLAEAMDIPLEQLLHQLTDQRAKREKGR